VRNIAAFHNKDISTGQLTATVSRLGWLKTDVKVSIFYFYIMNHIMYLCWVIGTKRWKWTTVNIITTSDVLCNDDLSSQGRLSPLPPSPTHPSALYGLSVHIAVQTDIHTGRVLLRVVWSRDPKQEENVNRYWWSVIEKNSEKLQVKNG
jgi:hypothetical protein